MPRVFIYDSTEMIRVNKHVTSYVHAMDILIDTLQDVDLLVKSKFLINCVGSKENVANMINNLTKKFLLQNSFTNNSGKKWMPTTIVNG